MDPLYKKAIAQGVAGMAVFVAFIFLPAGTWHYWQGWLFIAVFSVSTIGFTVYLAQYDRPLLERRMNAGPQHESEWSQKIIVSLIILIFFVFIILPSLDYRVGLSPVPVYLSFVGDIVIVLSFLFIFWVLKVNSFAAANISVADDHNSARGSRSVSSRSSCRYFSGGFLMRKGSCSAIFPATTITQAVCAIVSYRTSGRNWGPD
jgi:hypothetical protein